jgi:hypothetical protein
MYIFAFKYLNMAMKLEIPDSHLPEFKRIYTDKAYTIKSKIEELNAELSELEPILTQLGIKLNTDSVLNKKKPVIKKITFGEIDNLISKDYNSSWTWIKKSQYVITLNGAQTALQIIEALIKIDPTLNIDLLRRSIPATLSMATTSLNPIFSRIKNEKNEWLYDIIK